MNVVCSWSSSPKVLKTSAITEVVDENAWDWCHYNRTQVGVEPLEAVLSAILPRNGHGRPVKQRIAGACENDALWVGVRLVRPGMVRLMDAKQVKEIASFCTHTGKPHYLSFLNQYILLQPLAPILHDT